MCGDAGELQVEWHLHGVRSMLGSAGRCLGLAVRFSGRTGPRCPPESPLPASQLFGAWCMQSSLYYREDFSGVLPKVHSRHHVLLTRVDAHTASGSEPWMR